MDTENAGCIGQSLGAPLQYDGMMHHPGSWDDLYTMEANDCDAPAATVSHSYQHLLRPSSSDRVPPRVCAWFFLDRQDHGFGIGYSIRAHEKD